MSKTLRMLGAVALATAAVPFLAVSPAYADASVVTPGSQGYFNAAGIDKPEQSPAAPPNPINSVDGVDKDHLAVAARNGQEDKVSALMFDLSTLGTGAVVTKAELTLPLGEGSTNLQSGGLPEKVRVCAAGDTGFGGEDGAAIALAPARLCKVYSSPAGKFSADKKAYVYDITALAAGWVDGANDGLTLTAAEGALTTPFQVVFKPGSMSKLAVTFTPAPLEDDVTTPPADTNTDTGVSSSPDFSGGFSGGSDISTPSGGGFGSIAAPVVPAAPAPVPGVAPVAPAPETAPAGATGPVEIEMLRPTTAFWLGGLALLALLSLLSLIMGDPMTAPASAKRPSRLAGALADMQRGTGPARPTFGRAATI